MQPKLRFLGFKDDWKQYRLGDITDSYSGGTPKVGVSEYYNGEIPFIRSGEISSEQTKLSITKLGFEESSAALVKKGDILYTLNRATSGNVSRSKIDGAINQSVLAIIPHDNIDSEFLMHVLKIKRKLIKSHYSKGGQTDLSGKIVKNLNFLIPQYDEQQKIGIFLENFARLLTLHKQKFEIIERIKKELLKQMLS